MSPTVSNLRKVLDRKQFEALTPCPVSSAAGTFNVSSSLSGRQLFVNSASVMYLYDPNEDAFLQLPASGLTGTFGAGSCGVHHPGGPTGTAVSGTTNTITIPTTMALQMPGYVIRITQGTGAGQERMIASNTVPTTGNTVLTTTTNWVTTPDNTSQYVLLTGRWWIWNAGVSSTFGFRYYDFATNIWSVELTKAAVGTTWATDGRLVATPGMTTPSFTRESNPVTSATGSVITTGAAWTASQWVNAQVYVRSGTGAGQRGSISANTTNTLTLREPFTTVLDSTSVIEIEAHLGTGTNTSTTLNDTNRAWTASQFINQQVRITGGTGVGQVRTISANTGTQLTVGAAWTTTPDATSTYTIEGDDTALYLLGNGAVTLYKYSISAGTWATLAPGTARAAAPGAGMGGHWIVDSDDSTWRAENTITTGRRLYSVRGNATSGLDYYDIPSNAWTNTVGYARAAEVFGAGTGYSLIKDQLYIQKDNTGRFFRLNLPQNKIDPFGTLIYPQGVSVVGDKLFDTSYTDGGTTIRWLNHWLNSSTYVYRVMIV